jgi:hypothetical protein
MLGRFGIGILEASTVKAVGADEVMAVWTAGVGITVRVGSSAVRASPPLGAGGVPGFRGSLEDDISREEHEDEQMEKNGDDGVGCARHPARHEI